MYLEQERKFLVTQLPLRTPDATRYVLQGYLEQGTGVRVRFLLHHLVPIDDITIDDVSQIIVGVKQDTLDAAQRLEEEHSFDPIFFENFRHACKTLLLKTRHEYIIDNTRWEIDVYHENLEGLMVAEIEYEGTVVPPLPSFCGLEVTDNPDYRNENLSYSRT